MGCVRRRFNSSYPDQMKLQRIIGTYFITLAVYLLLDFLWLDVFAKGFYQEHIGFLFGRTNWIVAIVFYLIYTAGLVYLIIIPNLKQNIFSTSFKGGVVGLMAYSAYNLTNLATIKDWPIAVTFADIMWGFLLSLVTTLIVTSLVYKFKNPN